MGSVTTGECSKGIVPIENSIEGPVGITLDLLAHKVDLNIEKELIIPISHNLLVDGDIYNIDGNKEDNVNENKDIDSNDNDIIINNDINDIKDVYSHSQALAQCQNYLENHGIKTHFTLSTAAAAKFIKGKSGVGAIGTLKAAELYGLKAIDKNIQDIKNNKTRFVLLSKNKTKITGNDKTSILFSLFDDNPGGLHDILGVFAEYDINLTKIESRPSKEGLGKYIFFVDFEGHRDETNISNILNTVEKKVSYMKILGSYPKANLDKS